MGHIQRRDATDESDDSNHKRTTNQRAPTLTPLPTDATLKIPVIKISRSKLTHLNTEER